MTEYLGFPSKRWWLYRSFPAPPATITPTDDFNVFEKELAGVNCLFVQPKSMNRIALEENRFHFAPHLLEEKIKARYKLRQQKRNQLGIITVRFTAESIFVV